MPSVAAPISDWDGWVTDWNGSLSAQGIATSFKEAGCTVANIEITPIAPATALALGFPAGIDPDGGTLTANCSHASTAELRHPMSTPGAGYSEGTVGGPGTQTVYSCPIDDFESVCTSYGYGGDPGQTITGHVELSVDGALAMTCSVGTLIQNSGKTTLDPYDSAMAYDPTAPNGSNVWNGNFWKGSSNPYTNEGNICAGI